MKLNYDQRPNATVDEKLKSLMESVEMALGAIDGSTITGTINSGCLRLIKVDGKNIVGTIDGNTVFVKNLDARSIVSEEGWVDKLMVQTGLLSHEGSIFELDAIQVNAANITAGTIDVERLVVTDAVTGKKHMVTWNESTHQWEAAYLDGNAIADLTITADKIVAGAITADKITTQNIVGTGGWINLRNGTFSYQNASTLKGITWDGNDLNINASSILLGATDEDVAATLALKANKATLTSEINAVADQVKINAGKVDISGVITAINNEGSTTIDGGKITANSITANQIDASTLQIGGSWYSGTGISGTSQQAQTYPNSGVANAKVGDMYLNTDYSNTYKCVTAGVPSAAEWVYVNNIKGDQGTDITSQYVTYVDATHGVRVYSKANGSKTFGQFNAEGVELYAPSNNTASAVATEVATFKKGLIELGKDSKTAKIELCNGLATMQGDNNGVFMLWTKDAYSSGDKSQCSLWQYAYGYVDGGSAETSIGAYATSAVKAEINLTADKYIENGAIVKNSEVEFRCSKAKFTGDMAVSSGSVTARGLEVTGGAATVGGKYVLTESWFKTEEQYGEAVSVPANNNTGDQTLDITKTGYKAIGIVGFWLTSPQSGTHTAKCHFVKAYISTTNTITYHLANNTSSAASAIAHFNVLYIKTSL